MAGALATICIINFTVDPFRVFGVRRRAGFNDCVPNTSGFDRMAKPYEVLRIHPRTVLVGSSTAHSGFLPLSEWQTGLPKPAYNYALLGASAHEVRLSLEQTLRECPIEVAIMVADFFAFNAHYLDNERFDAARLSAATRRAWPGFLSSDLAAFLLGRDALSLSYKTLLASREGNDRNPLQSAVAEDYSLLTHFRNCERSYVEKWFPSPARTYEFSSGRTGSDRLADFDVALRNCTERRIRLIVICPPIHARFHEALAAAGALPFYEEWKREIARRTRRQQALAGGSNSIEAWDFSLLNEATCEPVPDLGAGPMRYFFDSAHFTPELGQLILNEILDAKPRFGVRLDKVEIEAHLASLRADLEQFRTANPGVIRDVRAAIGTEQLYRLRLKVSASGS